MIGTGFDVLPCGTIRKKSYRKMEFEEKIEFVKRELTKEEKTKISDFLSGWMKNGVDFLNE